MAHVGLILAIYAIARLLDSLLTPKVAAFGEEPDKPQSFRFEVWTRNVVALVALLLIAYVTLDLLHDTPDAPFGKWLEEQS
jgi:hypothetical protein